MPGIKKGTVTEENYRLAMEDEIQKVISFQEQQAGLDVLVHGEPERNDMVEYFAQFLEGFAFTANGWVAELWFTLRETPGNFR